MRFKLVVNMFSSVIKHMNEIAILVVDDEPQIRKLLRTGLSSYNYDVVLVANGQEALTSVARQRPSVIILDINLGSSPDGLEVCAELREWCATPIIMLTVNDTKQTKLAALDAGADDYVTKPFDVEELEARIRAVLRRTAVEESHTVNGVIHVHDLTIDLVKHRIRLADDEIHLTPTEYKLLTSLATHPGRVLTLKTLLQEITDDSEPPKNEHYVRVYVNTLRKKLRDDSASTTHPQYILSEPGVGYRFTDAQPSEEQW